jgi:hypothetical protein
MGMTAKDIFLGSVLIVGVVVGGGCRAMGSMAQKARNDETPASISFAGNTLQLETKLKYGPNYQSPMTMREQRDLEGRLIVWAPEEVAPKIDLYHFSVRPAKTGYYVQNFAKDRNGHWRQASASIAPVEVVVRREADAVVLDFKLVGWGSSKLNAPAYDVSVSMVIDGEVQRLARQAVPVE